MGGIFQRFGGLVVAAALLWGCRPDSYPRPTGFHRIEFPERTYQRYESEDCPFTFEYPTYGELTIGSEVSKATDGGVVRVREGCAIDIYFPLFGAYWHFTDRNFARDGADRIQSFEDYRKVVYKHSQKATHIQETAYNWAAGSGVLFELTGEVPTTAQLYVSDGDQNALMGSFYFKTAIKNDSLAPVIDYLKQDLLHLAETLTFQ